MRLVRWSIDLMDIDAQARAQATLGDTYASVLKSNLCLNKDHKE